MVRVCAVCLLSACFFVFFFFGGENYTNNNFTIQNSVKNRHLFSPKKLLTGVEKAFFAQGYEEEEERDDEENDNKDWSDSDASDQETEKNTHIQSPTKNVTTSLPHAPPLLSQNIITRTTTEPVNSHKNDLNLVSIERSISDPLSSQQPKPGNALPQASPKPVIQHLSVGLSLPPPNSDDESNDESVLEKYKTSNKTKQQKLDVERKKKLGSSKTN
ncbi:hypothetical protein RFI_30611 [Reticulomyxa filosa]|uniref:Uncharacterized protein n=1 Tax=Reticulomyxa filosa TaxID=46433 RepID=X6LZK3_RETFI|nr:hypothetical protein RFI_30611 [Reticulomyxa filosa]|eukprot:ETO06781.1 hypothetical protein RFI_30611 [Reticulomyxa filosa]